MRLLLILIGSMIITQLHAQPSPATNQTAGEENAIWRKFKTDEQTSARQLVQNKNLLQLGNDDNLTLLSTDTDQLGYTHYRYQQTYKDVPIEGAIYLMHEKAGQVKHANGSLARQLQLDAVPSISVDAALPHALAHIKAQMYAWEAPTHEHNLKQIRKRTDATFFPVGQLVILSPELMRETNVHRLAYKFDIYAIAPLSRQIVYIDAYTGEVLTTLEKIHHCAGEAASGTTHYSGEVNFTACQSGGTYTLESDLGGGIQVFNSNNTYYNPQAPFTDADGFFEADPAAVEVQWATETAYNYFSDVHNRNSLDDNDMPLHSWVHYGDEYNNAFWNGSWMTYGDGDNQRFSSLTAPDVIGHEMMHGITDFSADLVYSYESGALNESFSDIFGEVIEAVCNPNGNDWIVGGNFTVEPGKNGLRNMSNPNDPTMLAQQPDTYQGSYWHNDISDNGGVHINSGVQNYWFYLLSEGGSGINDNGDAYDVSPIGMEKAAAIAYRNLTAYLTPLSQYEDARIGAIQAAEDLYGENSEEVVKVAEAWCAVGVGACDINCQEGDYIALRALYLSTDGDNWTDNTDWMTEAEFIANPTMPSGTDVSTWYGIRTDATGCVICLDMDGIWDCESSASGGNDLTGNIPPGLSNLSQLRTLSLADNQLVGNIPLELGDLSNLEYLDLSANELSGNIPVELGNLNNLLVLHISDNQLIGNIPAELINLSNLILLNLSSNQLIGSIPAGLSNLSELRTLDLSSNQLEGGIPTELGDLNKLWALYLDSNQLTGNIPSELGNLEDLRFLYLNTNQLTDIIPPELGNLSELRMLHLFSNQFSGNIPAELGNLGSLTHLILFNNQLSGNIPAELGYLNSLTSLLLSGNQLSGCYSYSLIPLCAQLGATNQNISDGNNLDAPWEDFCATQAGICPPLPCMEDDYTALRALYLSTNGDNWTDNTGWMTETEFIANPTMPAGTDVGTWYGVTTNASGCVTCIDMDGEDDCDYYYLGDGNNLSGSLPPQLEKLNNLAVLILGNNQLNGNIPIQLTHLSDLTYLSLAKNQLMGNIPVELEDLVNLAYLDLNSNDLIGNIPPELGNLNNLTYLGLGGNELGGNIPPEIGNLSNLTYLGIAVNNLSSSIPSELGNLSNLITLNLFTNHLTGSLPPELGNLSNLTDLSLSGNSISGEIPPEFGNLSQLQRLSMANNQLSGSIPPELGNLNNLVFAELLANQLIGNIPPELANLDNLAVLTVSHNQLSGCYHPDLISLCSQLILNENDHISDGNNFDASWEDFCATQAGSCPPVSCAEDDYIALRALYLSTDGDNWVDNTGWLTEAQFIANPTMPTGTDVDTWHGVTTDMNGCLTELHLSNQQLNGSIPAEIGNLSHLTKLSIRYNDLIGGIPPEIGNLDNLIELNLQNSGLDGSIPPELGNLSNLRRLNLRENNISGSIPPELGNLDNLWELWLGGNQLIGGLPIELSNLNNLGRLRLSNNQLSGDIPPEIGNLNNLTYLNLRSNQFTGGIPFEIGNLSNLDTLLLSDNNLSGCYPANLTVLCEQLDPMFSNNIYISDDNNFDAPWEDFCATQAGSCTNFTDVYPGDFNNDNTANIQDLLYWGIAEGYEGIVRPNATINWESQPCNDWTTSAYGINSKHQDGNGDGIVNSLDLEALIANYDSVHAFAPPGAESPLQFVFEPVDYVIENDLLTMTYEMFIESSTGAPVSVHGLAFSLDFGGFPINNLNIDFDNSVLMPEEVMDIYNPSENILDVALTRTDKVNQVCNGSLLTAIVVTDNLDFMEPFEFQANNGQIMTTNGIDDTDGILTHIAGSTLTGAISPSGLFISVNTTPVRCNVGGTAKISYTDGTAPYTYAWSTGENTLAVSDLNIGAHQVTVTDSEGLQAVLDFDIDWTFTPVSATTDGSNICIDIENAPLSEAIEVSLDNGMTYMNPTTENVCYEVPEGEYQVWVREAGVQCPVYLDALNIVIDDTETIHSPQLAVQLINTLGKQSQIAYVLNNSGDMRVLLYNTHGQLIRTIEARHAQAGRHLINVDKNNLPAGLYYIHLEFATKNQPPINTVLKLPVID